jgi:hypothetical protein
LLCIDADQEKSSEYRKFMSDPGEVIEERLGPQKLHQGIP